MEATPLPTRGETVRAAVSIGISCYPNHGTDFETILDKADQAMYASKAGGKNRTTMFSA